MQRWFKRVVGEADEPDEGDDEFKRGVNHDRAPHNDYFARRRDFYDSSCDDVVVNDCAGSDRCDECHSNDGSSYINDDDELCRLPPGVCNRR